jgi:ABC-type multidrug transport system ATPase subunit
MDLDDSEVARRNASKLSGGMLRRLALCNAVVGDPKLLLLDEISAGVDPVVKRKIWKCVQMLKAKEDASVVISTHDTSEIAEMAQRITVLDKGFTLVQNESPFDLRNKSNTYSVKFYNREPRCTIQMAEETITDLCIANSLNGCIAIDSVSPHGMQLIISKFLSGDEILKLAETL